jgi:1-acyl-sn-glycerol-3-phosphate acyltransferase
MILARSALFNLGFHLLTAVCAVLALPVLLLPRRAIRRVLRVYARLALAWLRLSCGIRLRVTGAEHLPRCGPALIAAKHQSALDTIVWLRLLPDPAYVLKAELLRIPVWGWLARKARMIAVDRAAGGRAMRGMLRDAALALAEGRQVVIFPEGTRMAPGAPPAYQPGIAALASASGLPVIPVATDSGMAWPRRAFRKRPGVVTVAVLPALPAGLPRAALLAALPAAIEPATARLVAAWGLPGGVVENPVDGPTKLGLASGGPEAPSH